VSILATLESLEMIYLDGSRIRNLTPLAQLANLKVIDIEGTKITELSKG
jgi:Leucine-rich repeat (LRR) protein